MIISTPEFNARDALQQSLHDKRVAHLCIHNQHAYPLHDTRPGTDDRHLMNAFSQKNVAFAQALDPYVTTIQAQYDIGGLNRAWGFIARKKPDTGDFTDYYPERYFDYDQRNFKVSGIQDKNAPNGRYVDICSTSYNQHVFIGASQNVFSGLDGMGLADFMLENGWDVILGDGLYATACVPSTLCGALLKKFKVYAVTDMILTHPRSAREQKPHDAVIASYSDAIQRIDSVTTLQLVV